MRGGGLSAVRGEHGRARDWAQRGNANCGSPGREEGGRTLSRVGFLGSGLVAAAGAFGGYATQARAAETVQVWGLDPNWGGAGCGCAACASCLAHGANKLFASAASADAGRAHPYCKCLVVPLERLGVDTFNSFFVNGGGRESVDRRYQWVQAIVAHEAPAGQSSFAPPDDRLVRGAVTVDAVLGRVRIRRGANGQRVLYADIAADQPVTATLAITRRGPTVARKVVRGVNGNRRLKLAIPATTTAGPARLRVRIRNAAGTVKVVSRGIQIPHL